MVKLIVAVKKRPDMSVEQFQQHWQSNHAQLVRQSPATSRYVRKYIQCHTMPEEYERGQVAYDGTAELWFDTVEDKDAFFSDPDYLKNIQPDEGRFADMTHTVFFVTKERPIVDRTAD